MSVWLPCPIRGFGLGNGNIHKEIYTVVTEYVDGNIE